MNKEIVSIQQAIDQLLNAKTSLQPKKQKVKKNQKEKQLFIFIIKKLQESLSKQKLLINNGINMMEHVGIYYDIIDSLLRIKYGNQLCELIHFYIFSLKNPDGSINYLKDNQGNEIKLKSPEDLWVLINKISSHNLEQENSK